MIRYTQLLTLLLSLSLFLPLLASPIRPTNAQISTPTSPFYAHLHKRNNPPPIRHSRFQEEGLSHPAPIEVNVPYVPDTEPKNGKKEKKGRFGFRAGLRKMVGKKGKN